MIWFKFRYVFVKAEANRVALSLQYPFGAAVVITPIRPIEPIQADRAAGARGMYETPLANIDADVADLSAAAEEHQIGSGQAFGGDAWPLPGGKVAGRAREPEVEHVPIDIIDQSAAVEAAAGGVAAIAVGRSDQADGPHQHGVGGGRVGGLGPGPDTRRYHHRLRTAPADLVVATPREQHRSHRERGAKVPSDWRRTGQAGIMRGVRHGRHLGRTPVFLTSDHASPVPRLPEEKAMSTEALKIEKDRVVRFHYTLFERGESGQGDEPLETSKERDPLAILAGNGNIIPGLDKAFEGHAAGDSFGVDVAAADAYGERRDGLTQRVPKKHFGAQKLVPGMQVLLNTNFGQRAVTIQKVGMSVVDVDLNHPMAGKDLHFDIEIIDVREASKEELEHGHVHGDGGHAH
jgi:FKBP-type peptidyl-prolyl cis-trans isomerase SlyD